MNRIIVLFSVIRAAAHCHPQVMLVLALTLVFVFSLGLGMRPAEAVQGQFTATPAATTLENTPLPPAISSSDPTNGIIAGASLMVLIILGGTLSVLRSPSKKHLPLNPPGGPA